MRPFAVRTATCVLDKFELLLDVILTVSFTALNEYRADVTG